MSTDKFIFYEYRNILAHGDNADTELRIYGNVAELKKLLKRMAEMDLTRMILILNTYLLLRILIAYGLKSRKLTLIRLKRFKISRF